MHDGLNFLLQLWKVELARPVGQVARYTPYYPPEVDPSNGFATGGAHLCAR
jgi:hypothetical protein